ncbi:MAG: beta-lactamase family protein [Candidatus Handelsmanbacteria bacterium]|nr:beta-lactamase family protein [Candidatus Handelsmanbacteria bacterium]
MPLRIGSLGEAGLDPQRLERAFALLEGWAQCGRVLGGAMALARGGILLRPFAFGQRRLAGAVQPMDPEAVFLVASVTKPVTALAALILAERGGLSLRDRVCLHIPEFSARGKEVVQVIHLLTHTSGLPDLLPENTQLRQRHAPLAEFVAQICQCGLLFKPGTRVSYQSMGTAILGHLVERLSGQPLPVFMREEIFAPLGMHNTSLGLVPALAGRLAQVSLPEAEEALDWTWNSSYWQGFGAPWGGMFSTVGDLALFLQALLEEGGGVLGRAAAGAMIADQTSRLPELAPEVRQRSQVWGLGWCVGNWGDFGSARSFWHGGATGTQVGADPETGLLCALFTTQPDAPLHLAVNAVQGAAI